MGKWESICLAVVAAGFFGAMAYGGRDNSYEIRQKEETARIVSCNKLKEMAIAAKASEPTCAH